MDKIKHIVLWALGGTLMFSGVGWILSGGIFTGLLYIAAGVVLLPIPAIQKELNWRNVKGGVKIGLVVALLAGGTILIPADNSGDNPAAGIQTAVSQSGIPDRQEESDGQTEESAMPESMANSEPTPEPTETPIPTPEPTNTSTPESTPIPTNTPIPTATPIPTPEPTWSFNSYDTPEQQETEDRYVLNLNSMKVHHPECGEVRKIKPENYATTNKTIAELEAEGYSRCKSNKEPKSPWT